MAAETAVEALKQENQKLVQRLGENIKETRVGGAMTLMRGPAFSFGMCQWLQSHRQAAFL